MIELFLALAGVAIIAALVLARYKRARQLEPTR